MGSGGPGMTTSAFDSLSRSAWLRSLVAVYFSSLRTDALRQLRNGKGYIYALPVSPNSDERGRRWPLPSRIHTASGCAMSSPGWYPLFGSQMPILSGTTVTTRFSLIKCSRTLQTTGETPNVVATCST